MDRRYFGVDAGADTVAICALDEAGGTCGELSCSSHPPTVVEQLLALGANENCTVGIEAGGCGTQLSRALRAAGMNVRVLNARYVSVFLKLTQNKTDRNDAKGIAQIVRSGASAVPDVLIKTEAIQMLRSELVLRNRLMAQRIALENALRGTIRLNGGRLARVFSGSHLHRLACEEVERLRADGIDIGELVEPVLDLLVALRKTLERSDRRLTRRANDLDVCKRFMSIPGVGVFCALSFYTAVENPDRFINSADVGPYFGLVPQVSQSGSGSRYGRISRMGNTMTRTHLVIAAMSMMQQGNRDSYLRRWALGIAERAGRGKARVALARKLATVMLAMWKSGETFRHELV